jgi:aspartate aminotransferase
MLIQKDNCTGERIMDYSQMIAKKIKSMRESSTIAISQKANSLRKQGVDVISLAVGEPDFDTPDNIKQKAVDSITAGYTKYTPVDGVDELKASICQKFKRENNLDYSPADILVSCGAKHSLYNITQVLFEEDDEVIVLAPYWVTYPAQVELTGAKPVIIDTSASGDLMVSASELKARITPKTKAILLNNPCNPSGKVYSETELEIIAEAAVEYNIFIISDDIYEKFVYGGVKHVSMATFGEEVKARTITINGVSKAYAMTGWRIGYAAGPKPLIDAMKKVQGQVTSNPTSIAQYAASEALSGPQDDVDQMKRQYQERRDYLVAALNEIEGVSCRMPEGAFYVFPDISSLFGKRADAVEIRNSIHFCSYILDEARVALVPGVAFGCDNFIRFSYATDLQSIKQAMQRIKTAVEKLE